MKSEDKKSGTAKKSGTTTKKSTTTATTKKSSDKKIVKNNSSFKRAMSQIDIKSGETVTIIFDDGSSYKVEKK